MANVTYRFRDYSDEYSVVGGYLPDLTGIQTWSLLDDEADNLAGHLEAHSIGTLVAAIAHQATQAENDVRPTDPFAQRELGFRFYLRDDVNQEIGFFTVPCADLGIGSVVPGDDELDLSAAPTAAFVTFIEATLKSRDGNAVTVERALIVGRNS